MGRIFKNVYFWEERSTLKKKKANQLYIKSLTLDWNNVLNTQKMPSF